MDPSVSFIIPAYNEGDNVGDFLIELKKVLSGISQPSEIIVIDDGSTDDTAQKVRNMGVEVITHKENLGYGRSLKDGIRAAKGEYIFFIDADGTYDISKIPHMLDMARDTDLVIGKRVFAKKSTHRLKNLARQFFANQVAYYSKRRIEDLNSGQRVFKKKDIIDDLHNYPDGFSFTSTQVVFYIVKKKKKIAYTPVAYDHRGKGSKFLSRKQALAMIKLSLRLTFMGRPRKITFQLGSIVLASALITKLEADVLGGGLFLYPLIFTMALLALFFTLLCHIYIFGGMQKN
ncbi:MAG: glycosyltransferase family 2 protein [Candidatus Omnitrophota bacterium]